MTFTGEYSGVTLSSRDLLTQSMFVGRTPPNSNFLSMVNAPRLREAPLACWHSWQVSQTPDLEDSAESHISLLENQTLMTLSKMLSTQVYRVFWRLWGPLVSMSQCKFVNRNPGRT